MEELNNFLKSKEETDFDKDLLKAKGYEVFKRPDGSLGLRRQKGLADKIEQLSVDKDGIIIRIENKTAAMPPVNTVKGPKYNSCPDSSPCAKNAVEIIENNNQFVWVEEKARWFSPDGKRQIWFEDGWKYDGGSGVIKEFAVYDKYSMVKGLTPTLEGTNKSFMNGHHGIQSEWAEKCLGSYYNKNEAPAILLRDTFKDTPHQILTALQKDRKKTGSYFKQREYFKSDCKILGIPDEIRDLYLEKADAYFSEIYNQMLSDNILSKSEIDAKFEFNLIK